MPCSGCSKPLRLQRALPRRFSSTTSDFSLVGTHSLPRSTTYWIGPASVPLGAGGPLIECRHRCHLLVGHRHPSLVCAAPTRHLQFDLPAPAFATAAVPSQDAGPIIRAKADHIGDDRYHGLVPAHVMIAVHPAPMPVELFGHLAPQRRSAAPIAHADPR